MKFIYAALAIAAVLATSTVAFGAAPDSRPFVAPIFSDNMVLQRGRTDPVWGWTNPGARVKVSAAGKTASAVADSQGRWLAKIGPLPTGGPYTLTVAGPQTITLRNILVGDVWLCSGQSNMSFGIANGNNAAQEIAQADYPQIRLLTVPNTIAITPQTEFSSPWLVCTPKNVSTGGWGGFSAVAYFFGRDLYQKLHVPIGLIHSSWGGTPAESWTSAEALKSMPDFQPAVAQVEELGGSESSGAADYNRRMAAWWAKNDPGSASGLGWANPAYDASAWKTMPLPQYWEASGVAALREFDGVVWYRKEFTLPAEADGKGLTMHLGPIDDHDTTWVNGVLVGLSDQYATPRDYPIPATAVKPGRNVITVRVLDTGGDGGLGGKPEQMFVEVPGGPNIPLAGDWAYQISTPLAKASPLPPRIVNNPNFPTVLYNGMISPLIPFGMKGAIWYQGESNADRAYQYRKLLPTMIADWRHRWGEGDFPFLIVQLANFGAAPTQPGDDAWAELREAQSMTARSVPNAGLAVTIDIGDAGDIHPKDKQDVGRRLALAALRVAYGDHKIVSSGPTYKSLARVGSALRLTFVNTGGGLVAKGDRLTGFAIAGPDRHFVWADAVIDGSTIVVSSVQVANPVAVRYAWAANPAANLYNAAGLPASPFRTDTWPGITANNKK